jgi:hypothetical protein
MSDEHNESSRVRAEEFVADSAHADSGVYSASSNAVAVMGRILPGGNANQ